MCSSDLKIFAKAADRGLVSRTDVLSDQEVYALVFEPGFSTADEVSRLAGRGVGMDVVASEVRQLGGTYDIRTKKGEGTTFVLHLPQKWTARRSGCWRRRGTTV